MNLPAPVEQLRTVLSRYTLQQKLAMAGSAAMVIVMIWLVVYFVNRVDYQVLYRDMDPREAEGVVQRLREANVQYQLSDDGRSLSVPASRVSELRLQLASEGLPSTGTLGFEIFDRTNFGLTTFQEKVNYQRALEGELARSIMTLTEVEAARVHLVLPNESIFQSPEDQTKASVILKLRSGRNLAANSVQGIVRLVASSVKGLSPEKVSVVDFRGKILSRTEEDSSLTAQQLDSRQKMETEFVEKILRILEPPVGVGKVRPQVSVMLNWQQVEETVEQYDPNNSVVRSSQKSEERQPSLGGGGIPGPRSTQAAPPPDPASGTNPLVKQNETTNFEVSKSVKHTVNPTGKIERISVAVIVDNATKTTTNQDGTTTTQSEARKPEEMKKFRDLVAAAVGFNEERGDQIIVENVSFETEGQTITPPTFLERQGPLLLTALRFLIIPVIFVLVYILFLRPAQKALMSASASITTLPEVSPSSLQRPVTVRELEAQLHGGNPGDRSRPMAQGQLPPPNPTNRLDVIRNQIVEHAQKDPETVAKLVRVWLNEERNRE